MAEKFLIVNEFKEQSISTIGIKISEGEDVDYHQVAGEIIKYLIMPKTEKENREENLEYEYQGIWKKEDYKIIEENSDATTYHDMMKNSNDISINVLTEINNNKRKKGSDLPPAGVVID